MKTTTRLLSIVLSVLMVIGMMPTFVLAEDTVTATDVTNVWQMGDSTYATLAEAVEAATAGAVITLLADAQGAGAKVNKHITIDFGGYTYTLTEGVGSANTPTNGLQLLKNNNVALQNGALEVAEANKNNFYILVQNYANLTVSNMTLDGTNLDRYSSTDQDSYTLSNNSGTVSIIGKTNIIANDDGTKAFAFDVFENSSYTAPEVTVKTTGTINGAIDVSGIGDATLTIQGGTFTNTNTETVAKYLAYGLKLDENGKVVDADPIEIYTKDDLLEFAAAVNAGNQFAGRTVKLMGDIDLENADWNPITFSGTFDGNNHTIKNLTYVTTGTQMGFFNSLNGTAKNLTIDGIYAKLPEGGKIGGLARLLNGTAENVHIKNFVLNAPATIDWFVGGFAGYAYGYATNCSVENFTIEADNALGEPCIGGFIGSIRNNHTYTNCDVKGFKAVINATSEVGLGGFAPHTQTGWQHPKFVDCDVTGIDFTVTGKADVAGFLTWPGAHTTATNCSTEGKIDVTGVTGAYCVGGFLGQLGWNPEYGQMGHFLTKCSAAVDIVTKTSTAGGFIGSATVFNDGAKYLECTDCFATGDVICVQDGTAAVGGFAGEADRGVYTNCSASGNVIGNEYAGGFIGHIMDVTPKYDYRYPAGTRGYPAEAITIFDCESTSNVILGADGKTAGIVGLIDAETEVTLISNSYDVSPEFNIVEAESNDGFFVQMESADAKIGYTYYTTLAEAVAAANAVEGGATVTLLKDVTLGEKLTVSGNVTIAGEYTITRDDAYTGTLFAVSAGAILTLDGGLIIDGGNEYAFNSELYAADLANWEASVPSAENTKWFTPEEGAPVATGYMITASGTVNLNDVAIKNHYSTNGSGIVSASKGAVVTLTGAQITHNASTSGSGLVVNASAGVWSREEELITVTMNEGTVIDGNHVGGNHGIFKIYMGTYFTMNGGSIKNTTGWNSNGTVVGIYHAVFTMNGGEICSNSSVYGPNNGRNAAVYGHSNHLFTMNGGTICHNTGRSKAGVDSPYSETGYTGQTVINGGSVVDNTIIGTWTQPDVSGGATLTVNGGTFTQDVTQWLAPNLGIAYNEEEGTYGPTENLYEYNGVAYQTLAEVIEAIAATPATLDDETATPEVKVLASHKVDETMVITTDIILDLNDCTITGAKDASGVQVYPVIRVQNGANVTVKGGKITNADYVFVLGASDGSSAGNLTIENGTYHGQTTVASVTKGTLTINGGEFSVDPYVASEGAEPNYNFLLNCIDANYKDGSAKIVVTGGTFHNFDPANAKAENPVANFVAADYKSVTEDEGATYTVVPCNYVAEVDNVKYESLQGAINAAEAGETVKLLQDVSVTSSIVVADDDTITLELNGCDITNEIPATATTWHTIVNNGALTVIDSVGDGMIESNSAKGYVIYTDGGSLVVEGAKLVGINNGYAVVTWTEGDTITIEEGTVIEGRGAVYIDGGATGTINGGTFKMTVQTTNNQDNVVYVGGTSELTVNGGTFTTGDITGAQRIAIAALGTSKVTINGGKFYGLTGDVQAKNTCSVVITGGTFNGTKMDERATDTIAITGGNFAYDPTEWVAEGFKATEAEGIWTVEEVIVAEFTGEIIISGPYTGIYKSTFNSSMTLEEMLEAVKKTYSNIYKNVDITLCGNVEAGELVFDTTVPVKLYGGAYKVDGNFTVAEGTSLEIYSGTYSFDVTAWCAEGLVCKENSDGTYTVREKTYVEWVQEQLLAGNDVTLEKDIVITDYDLVHAHAWPSNSNGRYNEAHGNGAIFHIIKPGVELDLNGHSIIWDAHHADYCNKRQVSLFMVTATGVTGETADFTIKDSVGNGKVEIYGMATAVYSVLTTAKATIAGGTWINYPCKTCAASNIFMYPSHGATLEITGGTFEQKESDYLLGWKGSTKETTENSVGVDYDQTKVVITGGTFINFNPEEVKFFDTANSGQETIDGCHEDYASVDNGDGTYGVRQDVHYVSTKAELDEALKVALTDGTFKGNKIFEGDIIRFENDIDYTGTGSLEIAKAVTVDLVGHTLTTHGTYGGVLLKNNCSLINGTLNHKGTVTAIKAWNVDKIEDLTIDVAFKAEGKTIGGIVVQNVATNRIESIKNVTIQGEGLTNGIETYNCGDAAQPVIGSMDNVTIDAKGTGMLISAPCGTVANSTIKGGVSGIELWIKGTYSGILDLEGCTVEGGQQAVFMHDEFSSNPDIVNQGTLQLTIDDETTLVNENGALLTLTIARAENVEASTATERTVAIVGDTYYATIQDAVNAAEAGDTVEVIADVQVAETVEVNKDVTIDLGGKTVTGTGELVNAPIFRVLSDVIVTNGTVDGVAGGSKNSYAFIVGNTDTAGNLTIQDGTYVGVTSAVSVTKGNLTVLGGEFKSGHDGEGTDYGATYLLNMNDANGKNGTASIVVKGGTFYGFDPSDNAAENPKVDFVAKGYMSVNKGNDTYTVEVAPVAQNIVTDEVYYDVTDALNAAEDGQTVKLLIDYAETDIVVVPAGVVFDLNGKYLTANNFLSFGDVVDTAATVGGLKISNDTSKAFTILQPNNSHLPIYDGETGCYRFFEYKVLSANPFVKTSGETEYLKYEYVLSFKNLVAYELLTKDTTVIDFEFTVNFQLSNGTTVVYTFSEDLIREHAEARAANPESNNRMYVNLIGVNNLENCSKITSQGVVKSVTNAQRTGVVKTYPIEEEVPESNTDVQEG